MNETNTRVKNIHKLISRVEPALNRLFDTDVHLSIKDVLTDIHDCVQRVARHITNWLAKGWVLQFFTASKYNSKFQDDILEIKEILDALDKAIAIDTNIAIHRGFTNLIVKRGEHDKRGQAWLARKQIGASLEIPANKYTYKSSEPFAKGSSAEIFLVDFSGIELCAKVFNLMGYGMIEREDVVKQFKKELAINAKCDHENIVHMWGCTTTDPTKLVMLMTYYPKGSLRDVLDKKVNLPEPKATKAKLNVLRGVAEGMAYLYSQTPSVQHRDLKSLNVLIGGNHDEGLEGVEAKISDFGLSKSDITMSSMTMATSTGRYSGAPAWSAPEVLGQEGDFTEKSDVYSYAVIMWELFSGERPFRGFDFIKVFNMVFRKGDRPSPLPTNMDARLSDLMQKAWSQDPQARPTFLEILTVIDELQGGEVGRKQREDKKAENARLAAKVRLEKAAAEEKAAKVKLEKAAKKEEVQKRMANTTIWKACYRGEVEGFHQQKDLIALL